MSLETYHRKRDFNRTNEPKGRYRKASGGHSYLIQKHAARRLHYDFRLQLDGVLKSWAIPKGPSLNPKDKRLAVETEDHPLDYGDFEGVIPPDNYGAGTVMLWDRGEWQPVEDPRKGLAAGKLSFELRGERLHGRWALVKMRGRKGSGKEWLLVKEDDDYADSKKDPTQTWTDSVLTRRPMDAISRESSSGGAGGGKSTAAAETADGERIDAQLDQLQDRAANRQLARDERRPARLDRLRGARKGDFPEALRPQLATLYKTAPEGDNWVHEIKYDGYRLLVMKRHKVRLVTRNGKDWTAKFPAVARALEQLPECVLDGELVYLDNNGISNFQSLQTVLQAGDTGRLVYYAFDLPYLKGYDLTAVSLLERKALLADLVQQLNGNRVLYSDHFEGAGAEVLEHACQHRLEGIISKDAGAGYQSTRTRSWRKVKCAKRQELIVVGYTAPKGSRQGFGSLLLAYHQGQALKYAGKVGTGFDQAQLQWLHGELQKIATGRSPVGEPVGEKGVQWVEPRLVAEVEFTEWTSANRLRHPAFIAIREDKDPSEVVRENPRDESEQAARGQHPATEAEPDANAGPVQVAGVVLSSPDKVLYEQARITKRQLAEYYEAIADHMMPYVAKRPLTLVRCPRGHTRNCFFQKHLNENFDASVRTVVIDEKKGPADYAYVDSVKGLVSLVQMGTLEIHAWNARTDNPEKPDMLVFDLDPGEGVSWRAMKDAAGETREFLASLGLASFLRTSGGKGLHVVVPIERRHTWDQVKDFAQTVAQSLAERDPKRYIATASKAKRRGRVFIDYLRNSRGATSIVCYSTRSRTGAPVSAPLAWSELDTLSSSDAYRVDNILARVGRLKTDPWDGFHTVRQSLTQKMRQKLGLA